MDKKIISFEASEQLKELLRVQAFHKSVSVSALIREVLEEYLGMKPKTEEEQHGA